MRESKGLKLVNLLLNKPKEFSRKGLSIELLDEYFDGFSLNSLKTLLTSKDEIVLQESLFILSELGPEACNKYLDYVIELIDAHNITIQFYSMQCIFLGTRNSRKKEFSYLISKTKSNNETIKNYAFELIEKANNIR